MSLHTHGITSTALDTDPDLDPRFQVEYHAYDDPDDGQRISTWHDVQALCRGRARPGWVVAGPLWILAAQVVDPDNPARRRPWRRRYWGAIFHR